ncbi:hypothetical protein [Microbacterium ginsengisoli]|nr:hypothetical protein [Microbacteriaceae bacterium K1510]
MEHLTAISSSAFEPDAITPAVIVLAIVANAAWALLSIRDWRARRAYLERERENRE